MRDPIGCILFFIMVICGLSFIIDLSKFANFGKTSTPLIQTTKPAKRLQGFGLHCYMDDELTPCVYHRSVTKHGVQQ